ncbi:MAG TPA: hypothetical protein VJ375_17860 [Gaiellaceae bacterium]|nr:hypothetical protein [Gaiellaceae bacterium]
MITFPVAGNYPDFVFVSAAGSPPSDSTVRSNFYRARKAAGLFDAATSADETCERLEARAVGLQS